MSLTGVAERSPTGQHACVTEPLNSFDSDRHFQLWRYTVSHSQLVLRATRDEAHPTRVEVLFKGVDSVDLPTSFDGLHVTRHGTRFVAEGSGWNGTIAALAMFAVEDEREYYEPSSLFVGDS